MKIKAIISIMLALAMIASTFVIGADPTENPTDAEPFGCITKQVWNGTGWDDVRIADMGDTVRFKITVEYYHTSHPNASSVNDTWVNDTLPDCLEYADNASQVPYAQSGKNITWYLPGPYWPEDNPIAVIEFDTLVAVSYTHLRAHET